MNRFRIKQNVISVLLITVMLCACDNVETQTNSQMNSEVHSVSDLSDSPITSNEQLVSQTTSDGKSERPSASDLQSVSQTTSDEQSVNQTASGIQSESQSTSEAQSENSTTPEERPDNQIGEQPVSPWDYQSLLGKGMDVDWSKTRQGKMYYNAKAAEDFAAAGVSHVRIRIADEVNDELLEGLDRQIDDCLKNGIIPVIAYQADKFKNDPGEDNMQKYVKWWGTVAEHYRDASYLISFDLLIEATDKLNKQPEKLNEIYERAVTEIRKTNPNRILIISPRLRSDAAYLNELKIPTQHNNYLMAEWHFYAAGPSKTNERKLWTTGTEQEKALINEKIELALLWQNKTGIPTWVGAWMAGNYNDGNDYSVDEQVVFAKYMTGCLTEAKIPFAVNSDTKFYDRTKNQWITEMQPVFDCIFK